MRTRRLDPAPTTAEMALLQEAGHGEDFDYEVGSPHLRHNRLRLWIVATIRDLVAEQFARTGSCRVLEVGAGHGAFTDHVAATGAEVTVTEMSRPSLEQLRRRFSNNPRVELLHDPDGEAAFRDGRRYDLALCISVLHHIPDYLTFVERATDRIEPGGAFASFQDPLWYPRRGRLNRLTERGCYYCWRLGRGHLRQGVTTLSRRLRGIYDESNPSDMVEYHVVRQGVDEHRLEQLLCERFTDVLTLPYWSTQAPLLQALVRTPRLDNTFGQVARGRR